MLAALERGNRNQILKVVDYHLAAFEEVMLGQRLAFVRAKDLG